MTAALRAARHYIDGTRDDSGHKREVLAKIDAELSARPAVPGWRDIETAPKDGTPVLLCGDPDRYGRPISIDWWDDAHECWHGFRYSNPGASIIGWQPLPAPPGAEG